jgi:hypothetical protein
VLPRAHGRVAGEKSARPELADIFRQYRESYQRMHRVSAREQKVIRAVSLCRTKELGGHLDRCDVCGFERPAYNSCRTATAPNASPWAKPGGWKSKPLSFCRWDIFIWFSPCLMISTA